jgi:DNA-binding PadR family transcriptional regulator
MADHGVKSTAPAFYQMMARLERDRFVEGWYEQIQAGDQAVTERRYRITPAGADVWKQTQRFYESVTLAARRQRWSDA